MWCSTNTGQTNMDPRETVLIKTYYQPYWLQIAFFTGFYNDESALVYDTFFFNRVKSEVGLTHCGLMTPYGDRFGSLAQVMAWCHLASYHQASEPMYSLESILQEVLMNLIYNLCSELTLLQLPHLLKVNELISLLIDTRMHDNAKKCSADQFNNVRLKLSNIL